MNSVSITDKTVNFAKVEHKKDNQPSNKWEWSVADFLRNVAKPYGKLKDGPALLPAIYDGTRSNANAKEVHFLIYDIDDCDLDFSAIAEHFKSFAGLVYTTASYGLPDKPGMRARVLFILQEPLIKGSKTDDEFIQDYKELWNVGQRWMFDLGIKVDENAKDLARLMFLPRNKLDGSKQEPIIIPKPEGLLLDVVDLLAKYPEPERARPAKALQPAQHINLPYSAASKTGQFKPHDPENSKDLARARDALQSIDASSFDDPSKQREFCTFVNSALEAGLQDELLTWVQNAKESREGDMLGVMEAFESGNGATEATLFMVARQAGWKDLQGKLTKQSEHKATCSADDVDHFEAAVKAYNQGKTYDLNLIGGTLDDCNTSELIKKHIIHTSGCEPLFDRGQAYAFQKEAGIWDVWSKGHSASVLKSWKVKGLLGVWKTSKDGGEYWKEASVHNARSASAIFETIVQAENKQDSIFSRAPKGLAIGNEFYRADLDAHKLIVEPLKAEHYQLGKATVSGPYKGNQKAITAQRLLDNWMPNSPEMQKVLLEAFGCALLGIGQAQHKAIVLYGDHGRGKSTALEILKRMMPRSFTSALSIDEMEGHTLLPILNSRVNICGELAEETTRGSTIRNIAKIKSIIGGDEITFNPKGLPTFNAVSPTALFFSVNPGAWPSVSGIDEAFKKRWMCIEFSGVQDYRSFGNINVLNHFDEYAYDLMMMCIDAARALIERGHGAFAGRYSDTERGQDLLRTGWFEHADTVSSFMTDCLIPRTSAFSGANQSEMYEAYIEYCLISGLRHTLPKPKFKNAMIRHGARLDDAYSRGYKRWSHELVEEVAEEPVRKAIRRLDMKSLV